ncbi:hypothetical protein F5Y11DRAFT_51319 [Daldinia sp. FL1419]|nr:hypothetical protein F5Y11DRAFT_51319 [Daldinia sp. FL1419]
MPTEQEEPRAMLASRGQAPRFSALPKPPTGNGAKAPRSKTASVKPENRGGRTSLPNGQSHRARPLEPEAILSNPRLQQVTGLHPRKVSWWKAVHPPIDELARLQWAMSLPDAYPAKRPKGNY